MPKHLIDSVIKQLKQERARLEKDLQRVTAALSTFGKVFENGNRRGVPTAGKKRIISAAGRRRIAAAQRARWAKMKAANKGV